MIPPYNLSPTTCCSTNHLISGGFFFLNDLIQFLYYYTIIGQSKNTFNHFVNHHYVKVSLMRYNLYKKKKPLLLDESTLALLKSDHYYLYTQPLKYHYHLTLGNWFWNQMYDLDLPMLKFDKFYFLFYLCVCVCVCVCCQHTSSWMEQNILA